MSANTFNPCITVSVIARIPSMKISAALAANIIYNYIYIYIFFLLLLFFLFNI